MSKKTINLPTDYALVLQQIKEDGEDDIDTLSHTLSLNRHRVSHIVKALHHKGFVQVYGDMRVVLSRKGKKIVSYLWPESEFSYR